MALLVFLTLGMLQSKENGIFTVSYICHFMYLHFKWDFGVTPYKEGIFRSAIALPCATLGFDEMNKLKQHG